MKDNHRIYLVLITIDLIIADADSLKSKRAVIKRIKDRIKSRFNVSIAEVGELEKWQRSSLAITMVSNEKKKLQQDADRLKDGLLSITEVSLSDFYVEWL
jgi:uncharacterized protein YlxP (DUF503 family)